jgi:cytoskeletal protein CcmA (bactofilin family)
MLGRRNPEHGEPERSNTEDNTVNTVIGRGSVIDGIFTVQGSVRVDGRLRGTMEVSGSLFVGKEGEIDGEVRVRDAFVGGKVKNKILASGRVTLEPKSVVQGEVNTSRLVIEEGAIFEGNCVMNKNGKLLALPDGFGRSGRPR